MLSNPLNPLLKALLLLISLTCCTQAFSQSSVWKISKEGHTIYIGGTIHLLRESDYPLPKEFLAAYARSDSLKFEANIDELELPLNQFRLMSMMTLSQNITLKDKLSDDTWKKLENFASEHNFSLAPLEKFEPTFVSLMISVQQMQNLGFESERGVEHHFSKLAEQDKKPIGFLESIDEQFATLKSLIAGDPNQIITNTLNEFEQTPKILNKMTQAWRIGDTSTLNEIAATPMKESVKALYQVLLINRNKNWIPHIEKSFSDKQKAFILVGCLHLVGDNSVLDLLAARGYTIERLVLPQQNTITPKNHKSENKPELKSKVK